jgi:hypothetical protein
MATPPPDWKEATTLTPVFRFVPTSDDPTPRREWFLSDNEVAELEEKEPRANRVEREHPDLLNGMSVFQTRDDAQKEFDAIHALARVCARPPSPRVHSERKDRASLRKTDFDVPRAQCTHGQTSSAL